MPDKKYLRTILKFLRPRLWQFAKFFIFIFVLPTILSILTFEIFEEPQEENIYTHALNALEASALSETYNRAKQNLEENPLDIDQHYIFLATYFLNTRYKLFHPERREILEKYERMAESDNPVEADIGNYALGYIDLDAEQGRRPSAANILRTLSGEYLC